ncbi:asparagine synthetase B family protein [Arsukibacterium indicum]|uniref:asparagine synthase (glutamine-hydrolyzing) n=1 Tax=Arsukibacterium indicum TaxID=2848612 RepID=A0ABS6MHM2_9GAMM|nr:asparagine synthase-related protein [Arsukibacterium indicum]MBV2127712.1 asparagine synthase [Arsukibacterium indicum]
MDTHVSIAISGCPEVHIAAHPKLDIARNSTSAVVLLGRAYWQQQPVTGSQLLQQLSEKTDISALYKELSGAFYLVVIQAGKPVLLVNDIMGVQSCYYALQQQVLYVGHSLRQLKQLGVHCSLNKQAIYNYIYFHCIPAPDTIYQQVFKLEPAYLIAVTTSGISDSTLLYSPDFNASTEAASQLQQQCLQQLDNAVQQHLAPDCGAFLSGGLDSSTVAGMVARHQQPAHTYSIGFKAKGYDETEYALITAKHFNTSHQVHYLTPEHAAEAFVKVAQYFDEPFGNSSAMAAYFCARFAKEDGRKVLLAGDGGDELFAGNSRYAKQKVFEVFANSPSVLQTTARALFVKTPLAKLPGFKKVASYIRQADEKLPLRLQTYNFITQFGRDVIFTESFLADIDPQRPEQLLKKRYEQCKSSDPVDKMLFLDWKFTLADNDLVKVSKMCELAGIEVRYPLLNKALVDFSCKVPADMKLPGQKLRDFYKKSCKGFLADETLTKEKHGFGLPFGVWLTDNAQLKTLALDALNAFRERNIVKTSLIDAAIEAHTNSHASYYGELIWILVVLELWLQAEEQELSDAA